MNINIKIYLWQWLSVCWSNFEAKPIPKVMHVAVNALLESIRKTIR
jgi:hypothetical protein